ncbi:MAG: hypothetical protein KGI90_17090 [Burkholderiales bacterium]|nr:hypothetical protein [Burkholderiales bacterium]
MCGSGDKPPRPSANGAGTCPPGATTQTCPLKKPHLVELIEVVARSPLGTVVGAGAASGRLPTKTTRTDKNGAAYQQFINLGKDIDGADKRHPEYGRPVELRARVEGEGSLAGLGVRFRFVLTKGAKRPDGLAGAPQEGFGSAGGGDTTTASTDAEGWTETVQFHLSQYAGDQYEVYARLADGGAEKSIGKFEVWRRFWYQITRSDTHAVPAPAQSIAAYKALAADMRAADEVTFTQASAPASTFYPGWMVRTGGGDGAESVIGGHNRSEFYKLYKDEPGKPVKGHLIICHHQWDPIGVSDLVTAQVATNPSAEITVDLKAWNAGLVKPALSGSLVALGQWSQGAASGALGDDDIQIVKGRSGLNCIKVRLPAGAPDPSVAPVTVKLKLNYGKYYAGESNGHHMLIVYRGESANFNQVVSHEFGHGFGQTPRPGSELAPLPAHAHQYDNAHGGQGSHCSTEATEVVDPTMTSGKRWTNGSCIMFHQVNPGGCKQLFCATCEPHLRLQSMAALT